MTQEALTPLQRLENRIDTQDRCIEMITQIMEQQDRKIERLEETINKLYSDKRKALGRTIDLPSLGSGSATETLLSSILGPTPPRKYNE